MSEKEPRIGYAIYSQQMADYLGSYAVYRTPDGREVNVTDASLNPDHSANKWPDKQEVGEVLMDGGWVREVVTNPRVHAQRIAEFNKLRIRRMR